jgi:hypothetical protein
MRTDTPNISLEVRTFGNEFDATFLLYEGEAYVSWVHVYKYLKIDKSNARKVLKKLTEGIHYKNIPNKVLSRVSDNTTLGYNAPVYTFLSHEGFNRIIIAVNEDHIDDSKVVEWINQKRDLIASVFTAYEQGKLVLSSRHAIEWSEKRHISKDLQKQNANALTEYHRRDKYPEGKIPTYHYMNEDKMNNKIALGEHRKNIRNDASIHGLDILTVTLAGDNALLDADIPYVKRKEILTRQADQLVNRSISRLMTPDEKRLISSRSLSKAQATLF